MPNWNLRDDWPKPEDPATGKSGEDLFKPPLSETILEDAYTLSLDTSTQNQKKLVIGINSQDPVDILAMTPGTVRSTGSTLTLTTPIFSLAELILLMFERQRNKQEFVGLSSYPVAWFRNWLMAGLCPSEIIYENVQSLKNDDFHVNAGEKIGTSTQADPQKEIRISIKYYDYTPGEPRFMHPREFFSLLFWEEKCDPIFNETPSDYTHPLLGKMMKTYEKKESNPVSNVQEIIDRLEDDWLGLRPPLRTFQRVKWEHIKEHMRGDYGIGTWTGTIGNVQDRILNAYVHKGGPAGYGKSGNHMGYNKCNIYCGEMLFRSGFRTIIWAEGLCPAGKIPHRLKYVSPPWIRRLTKKNLNTSGEKAKICYNQTTCTANLSTVTHQIHTIIGAKATHEQKNINDQIEQGCVFVIASELHVPIIHDITSLNAPDIKIRAIHQWLPNTSGFSKKDFRKEQYYADTHWPEQLINNTTIVKIEPGGDPTEEWGKLESNCLKKVP
jgi:hypothetical protein